MRFFRIFDNTSLIYAMIISYININHLLVKIFKSEHSIYDRH